MRTCEHCNRIFPDKLVGDLYCEKGNTVCCYVCAQRIINRMVGLPINSALRDEEAEALRIETQKYIEDHFNDRVV